MKQLLTGTAILCSMSLAATAQSLPGNVYVEGSVIYEYLFDGGTNDANAIYANATIGIAPSGNVPIGAELYLEYVDLDAFGGDANFLGGIVYYDTSFGRFSLGTPMPTIQDYVDVFEISPTLDYSFFGEVLYGATPFLIRYAPGEMYGARFDGQSNNFSYGVSIHYFTFVDDYVYTLSGQYRFDNYTIALGHEGTNGDSFTTLSATAEFGDLEATLHASRFSSGSSTVGVTAKYNVTPDLVVDAGYLQFQGGSNISRLGVEYQFFDNAYVGANILNNFIGGDTIYSVYAGYDFSF